MTELDKIQGYLIAGAIGDAIGFIVEHKSHDKVLKFVDTLTKTGRYSIPFRTYPRDYLFGQYSDDTQFSKILIESYLQNKEYKNLLVQEYSKGSLVGLGTNTNKALGHYLKTQEPIDLKLIDNLSNGALMRTGVIGLLVKNEKELSEHVQRHSNLTHTHRLSIVACNYFTLLVHYLLQGNLSNSEIINLAPVELKEKIKSALEMTDSEFYQSILNSHELAVKWQGVPPFAIETCLAVVVTYLKYQDESFMNYLGKVLSLGGDTDSTASLACALWGMKHGIKSIPNHFRGIIHDEGKYKEDYFLELATKVVEYKK